MFAALMFKNPRVRLSTIEQHTLGVEMPSWVSNDRLGAARPAAGGAAEAAGGAMAVEIPVESTPVRHRLRREGLISKTQGW